MKRFVGIFSIGFLVLSCILLVASSEQTVSVREEAKAEYGSCEVHVYPDEYIVVREATCSQTGLKYRNCVVCGAPEIVEIPLDPNVHKNLSSFWMYDPAPTCVQSGLQFHICYDCNARVEETVVEPDPQAHVKDGDVVVLKEATCTETGEAAYRCKLCGEYFDYQELPVNPENHVTSDTSVWEVTVMPTCALEGEMVCYCDSCGQIALVKTIEPTGLHEPSDEWVVDSEPTCVADGVESRHCVVCGAVVESRILPSDPDLHTFSDEFTVDREATCSSTGEESRHCLFCDAKTDIRTIPMDPDKHIYSEEWIVTREPTCSELGLMHRVCLLCGKESVSTVIEKTDHTYGAAEVVQQSADGLSAMLKYTCTVCGYEYLTVETYAENTGNGGYIGDSDSDPSKQIYELLPVDDTILVVNAETLEISNIARNTTMRDFYSYFLNSNSFVLYSPDGTWLSEDQYVRTGCRMNYTANGISTDYRLSVTGDVDSDGQVTAADARIILRCAAGMLRLENEFFTAADVDLDGQVTAADARKTLRVSADLDFFEETYKNHNRS